MPRHHKHSHSSSDSSSSDDKTPKVAHSKRAHGWVEVKLPKQRCHQYREGKDKALGINYARGDPNYQMILRKKNSNIAPKHLS